MRCFFCGSPAAHPSSGCVYSDTAIACSRCTREFWTWMREHTNKRGKLTKVKGDKRRSDFYAAAGKWKI